MTDEEKKTEEQKIEETATDSTAVEASADDSKKESLPEGKKKEEKQKAAPKFRRTARGKKRLMKKVPQGRACIKATYNNTIVTLTDMNGNTLAWASAGNCGFKGPKKATPYAASVIVKNVAEKVADYGLKEVAVTVRGIGSGRDSAIRSLNANGFTITSMAGSSIWKSSLAGQAIAQGRF